MEPTRGFKLLGDDELTMNLVSAGMRRKSIVFVQVDVYVIGLYLTDSKHKLVIDSVKEGNGLDLSKETLDGSTYLCIVLKFARNVGQSAFIDAIVDALASTGEEYQQALVSFKSLLSSAFGPIGIKTGDEIVFGYHGSEDMTVSVKGSVVGTIRNRSLRMKLIDIYAGANSVTPEVVSALTARFSS